MQKNRKMIRKQLVEKKANIFGGETQPARTAQGGGGSFKDRKPIGEVGCCDAWMAGQSH